MISDLICRKCGSINSTNIVEKKFSGGSHHAAYCAGCGAFIKNIPHDAARFYFGKYKGMAISECTDIWYMEWFYREVKKASPYIKNAIAERIELLKSGEK